MQAGKLLFDADTKFLAQCRNAFGGLKGDVRQRLLALLNHPCQATWDNAHTIIIACSRMASLWQAVIAVDPTFPRSKGLDEPWPVVPDQFTLCRAIKQATRAVQAEAESVWGRSDRHD